MLELLVHSLKREGLTRLEEAARTEDDFRRVVKRWDELWDRRLKKENSKESLISSDMFDWSAFDAEERMRDTNDLFSWMFGCICQMHELTDDPDISRLLKKATHKQKAVFFPRYFKNCSTTTIASCHGMTDRNVRKLIDLMLDNLRRGLYEALVERHRAAPLTATLRERLFLANYDYKPKEKKGKKNKAPNDAIQEKAQEKTDTEI